MHDLKPSLTGVAPESIVVTGSSGYLGGLIVERLLRERRVQRVVGLDIRPERGIDDPRYRAMMADVCTTIPDLEDDMRPTCVVHMAYPLSHPRRYEDIQPFARDATLNLFEAARRWSTRQIVLCSSTTVYGCAEDGSKPFDETDFASPSADYHYAVGKLEMETLAAECARRHPDLQVIIVRPCIVMGPQTANYMVDDRMAVAYAVRGKDPKMQLLHEEDFVDGLYSLLLTTVDGVFNLVPRDEGVRRSEIMQLCGVDPIEGRYDELRAQLVSRWEGAGDNEQLSPAWLDYISRSWSASPDKLQRATGFTPVHNSSEALLDYFKAFRARRRTHRKVDREFGGDPSAERSAHGKVK